MAKKVTKKSNPKWVAKKYGFKSGLEENISQQIESHGIKVEYETVKPQLKKSPVKQTKPKHVDERKSSRIKQSMSRENKSQERK